MILEGNEVEGQIGQYGGYSVDIDNKGIVKAQVSVEIDLVAELEKLAKKSPTLIDDKVIGLVKAALGRV
jgi:hypothetical protein